jgi:hypothetical protein
MEDNTPGIGNETFMLYFPEKYFNEIFSSKYINIEINEWMNKVIKRTMKLYNKKSKFHVYYTNTTTDDLLKIKGRRKGFTMLNDLLKRI